MREKGGIQGGEREWEGGREGERNKIEPSGAERVCVKQSEHLERERLSQRERETELRLAVELEQLFLCRCANRWYKSIKV